MVEVETPNEGGLRFVEGVKFEIVNGDVHIFDWKGCLIAASRRWSWVKAVNEESDAG